MHHPRQGVAIIIFLIFLAVIIPVIVATSSVSSLTGRRNSANTRQGYQALLSADSQLNTLPTRYNNLASSAKLRAYLPTTSITSAQETALLNSINTFVSTASLRNLSLDSSTSSTLTATDAFISGSDVVITMEAAGTTGNNARSKQRVLKDFYLRPGPPFVMRVPGALTAVAQVSVRGGGTLEGQGYAAGSTTNVSLDWMYANVASALPNGALALPTDSTTTFDVPLNDATLFRPGSYLRISGFTYKVLFRTGNTVTLVRLANDATNARTILNPSAVDVFTNAAAASVTITAGSAVFNLPVADVTEFAVGDVLFIGNSPTGGTTCPSASCTRGVVQSISGSTLTVAASGVIDTQILEGDPVVRGVYAAASSSTIGTTGQGTIGAGGSLPNTTLNTLTLFQQIFGMSKADMLGSTYQGGILSPISPSALPNPLTGVNFVVGNVSYQGNNSLCGTGILIVHGNFRVNGTCSDGFQGLIYVTGEYDQQGQTNFQGAAISESNVLAKIAGNGSNPNSQVKYNSLAILRASQYVAPLQITSREGSWRQQ